MFKDLIEDPELRPLAINYVRANMNFSIASKIRFSQEEQEILMERMQNAMDEFLEMLQMKVVFIHLDDAFQEICNHYAEQIRIGEIPRL